MTDAKTETKASAEAKAAEAKAASRADAGVGTWRVVVPLVTLKSRSADTGTVIVLNYLEGAIVPESVDLDDLARHIRKGMVERVEGSDLKSVKEQQDAAAKAAEVPEAEVDKEGVEAVKDAEVQVKEAEEAEEKADAEAKKTRTPRIKASDSPRGLTTAQQG